MVDTGKKHVPWNVLLRGRLLGVPDIWGNKNADSSALIEFRTSDQRLLSLGGKALLASDFPGPDGYFAVTSIDHLAALDSLSLLITNAYTYKTHEKKLNLDFAKNFTIGNTTDYDFGEIQVPWAFDRPIIARLNGHDFRYPADLAFALINQLKPFNNHCQIQILRTMSGQPDPDPLLDKAFKALQTESLSPTSTGLTGRFATEVNHVLNLNRFKFRFSTDFFQLALEQFSDITFNTERNSKFHSFELAQALIKAFGFGFASPFLDFLQGRASFFALLFLAAFVAKGNRVNVWFAEETVSTSVGDIGYYVTYIYG